jgi:hypothetical protein
VINVIIITILFVGLLVIGLVLLVTNWRKFVKPLWLIAAAFVVITLTFSFLILIIEIGFWGWFFLIVGLPFVGISFAAFSAVFLSVTIAKLITARRE